MPSTASSTAASAKLEITTVLKRRGASLCDTTCSMVCTWVSGNWGSMERTTARTEFSICSGGSAERSTM
jgi:hypothetical protein